MATKKIPSVKVYRRVHREKRVMVAMRIPTTLWRDVKLLTPEYKPNTTALVIDLLEQFIRQAKAKRR